jgi:hypothetical protein
MKKSTRTEILLWIAGVLLTVVVMLIAHFLNL